MDGQIDMWWMGGWMDGWFGKAQAHCKEDSEQGYDYTSIPDTVKAPESHCVPKLQVTIASFAQLDL